MLSTALTNYSLEPRSNNLWVVTHAAIAGDRMTARVFTNEADAFDWQSSYHRSCPEGISLVQPAVMGSSEDPDNRVSERMRVISELWPMRHGFNRVHLWNVIGEERRFRVRQANRYPYHKRFIPPVSARYRKG